MNQGEKTPGGVSTKELTRSEREKTFTFSKAARSSNPARPRTLRRPFLEYAPPPETRHREGGTGSWGPPPRAEKPHVKLDFVDGNNFQPRASVAESRRAANQQSLSTIRRQKRSRVKSLRPAPLNRTTLFTDCSGPGSGVGTGGFNGGFNAARCALCSVNFNLCSLYSEDFLNSPFVFFNTERARVLQ
jgi:hypothetical protein